MSEVKVIRWRVVYAPNPAVLRLKLGIEGYRIFHWVDRPGIIYGIHKHEEDQTHWIVSGELEIVLKDGGNYILKAGDRDYLPANTLHSARVLGEEPVSYLVGEKIKIEIVKRKRGRPKKK
jgi:mannose-6-phosphate isomerase-like protein (cupin superfamily)